MFQILLIEDEQSVADLIKKGLEEEGYTITHAGDGKTGLNLLTTKEFNLVILDILLPEMNGLEVCKSIRQSNKPDTPILMLTALGSPENVALGLDSGADDYLSKPFKLIELKARIRNLLRRADYTEKSKNNSNILTFQDISLDDYSKVVKRNGQEVSLTSTEYRLLLMFLKNPGRVIARTELLDEVWGINFDIGTNVVDVYVNYLRKKLEANNQERVIHTVIGMGYVLKKSK